MAYPLLLLPSLTVLDWGHCVAVVDHTVDGGCKVSTKLDMTVLILLGAV